MRNASVEFVRILAHSRLGDFLVLLAVPVLTALLVRATLKAIEKTPPSSRFPGMLLLSASCAPGLVFLSLAPSTIHHLNITPADWACAFHCYTLAVIFAVFPIRAGWRLLHQARKVKFLLGMTRAPSEYLADLAADLNIPVLELPTDRPVCFAAGVLKQRVVVSTGAANLCSRSELRAALLHERAHCKAHAAGWATLSAFLNDCSPYPVKTLTAAVQHRSELTADLEALRHADPQVLVSAMLKVSEYDFRAPGIANFADRSGLERRVESLLTPDSPRSSFIAQLSAACLSVGIASLPLTPALLHAVIRILTCPGAG